MDLTVNHLLDDLQPPRIDVAEERKIQAVEILDVVFDQIAEGDAPRFMNRGRATGQGNVFEMGGAFEIAVFRKEHFPAPDGAIGAVAGAIEGDADHFSIKMIFGHAGSDMRVVMLYANQLHGFARQRPFGGKVIGMEIVGNHLGLNFQDALQVLDGFLEEVMALKIFQIADVLAEKSFAAARDADSVLQFCANGQNGWGFVFEGNWRGNKAARTAQYLRAASGEANDRVVAAAQDIAIVDEVSVGNRVEAPHSFFVVDGDGLFAEVGAGHDQSVELAAGKKKMVQRGVGQEDAEKTIAGSDAVCEARAGFAREQDDGSFDGEQALPGGVIDKTQAIHIFQATEHDGERLFDATLVFAKPVYSNLGTGIASQMKPSKSFYRENAVLIEKASGFPQRLGNVEVRTIGGPELQLRAAIPTGVRLRMETAVGGVVIFCLAGGAHLEGSHGSARAVVRNISNDGEPRATVGAIDKGIAEAAVARAHHFAQAIAANGYVRRNESFGWRIEAARENAKGAFRLRFGVTGEERSNFGQRRKFGGQTPQKAVQTIGLTLDFDRHSGRSIGNETGEIAFLRKAKDKGAKADTLDDAGDVDGLAHNDCSGRFVHGGIIAESSGIDSSCGLHVFVLESVQPMKPLVEAFARPRGESNGFDFRVDLAGVFEGEVGIELDVRKQVGFGKEHERGAVENAGILEGFVFAFGDAQENDFCGFAEVIAGRTNEVANIFHQ